MRRKTPGPLRCALLLSFALVVTFTAFAAEGKDAADSIPSRPDIIVILVDTLRADYLGAYGFIGPISPHLDRLAEESIRFDRCISAAPWTKPSVASLFTSLLPETHRVLDHRGFYARDVSSGLKTGALPEQAITLAEILSKNGYRTAGWSANGWINDRLGFAQGFEVFHGTPSDDRNLLNADEILRPAFDWLMSASDRRPAFLYLHLMDTHGPWRWNPEEWDLLRKSPSLGWDREISRSEMIDGKELARFIGRDKLGNQLSLWRGAYAAGVRVMDMRVGAFLDKLRSSGRFNKSLIVFTADHGEELLDHGGWGHGWSLHSHQTRVPLLIRLPGGDTKGRVEGMTVSGLDLMPTLLSAAGVSGGLSIQGRNLWNRLVGEELEEGPFWAVAQGVKSNHRMVSLENGRFKLIWEYPDGSRFLYDQERDPMERHNLAESRPDLLEALEQRLIERMKWQQERPELLETGVELTQEEIERLRLLGYLK